MLSRKINLSWGDTVRPLRQIFPIINQKQYGKHMFGLVGIVAAKQAYDFHIKCGHKLR